MNKLPGPDDLKSVSKLPDSDDLKIDLDEWHEKAQNDDPEDIAMKDIESAAERMFVALQKEGDERLATYSDMMEAMQKHPELVAAHALAHGISRIEVTYRILKVEELRLLKSIADSLKGKGNE